MWPNPQFFAELVTFTEEILNRKLHLLYSVIIVFSVFSPTTKTFKQSIKKAANTDTI